MHSEFVGIFVPLPDLYNSSCELGIKLCNSFLVNSPYSGLNYLLCKCLFPMYNAA